VLITSYSHLTRHVEFSYSNFYTSVADLRTSAWGAPPLSEAKAYAKCCVDFTARCALNHVDIKYQYN